MFSHPFLATCSLSLALALLRRGLGDLHHWAEAFLAFSEFPLWATFLVFFSFYVIRSVRESWLYRYSRTLHHRIEGSRPFHSLRPLAPPSYYQATTAVTSDRDITSASPRTPTAWRSAAQP